MTRFGQKEWAILLKDLDPVKKKTLIEDDEVRSSQIEALRTLFALGCEARKVGLASEPINADELRFTRSEVIAVEYDKRFAKSTTGVAFSRITDAQVARFYLVKTREKDFDRFLEVKIELIRKDNPEFADRVVSAEEIKLARDLFAKIGISANAAALLGEPFRSTAAFKVRLQQEQFLSRLLGAKLADNIAVNDDDVARFIATHPELDVTAKKAEASKILERAKAGENFAALADEFSEDPGNTGFDGKKSGGLYADVPLGVMVPTFEKGALALEPGQVSAGLVESDHGFHVIKLEKKDSAKYDVRHILIGTKIKDPDDPNADAVPVTVFARTKLEREREDALIEGIIARNPVVIEDYKPPVAPPVRRTVRKKR